RKIYGRTRYGMSIEITTLPNGLRVATDNMREAESAVIGAWVGVGTRNEPWSANGVAHLVEHMMFKGTKKRSAYALSAAIERNGGMMNAHTTREETAYYARVLPEDAGLACEIIADMLQHSRFDSKELDRERLVVIQEIGRDRDTPEDYAFDLLHQTAFPRQRIGRPILGSAKVIASIPRHALTDYVKQHYHAGNMVIVAAGRIEHKAFVEMAKKRFGRLPNGKPSINPRARAVGGEARLQKPNEQLHFILGFPAEGFHAKSLYATQLLGILLGGTSSSRLFQKVREKRGLVYTVNASHIAFSDAGIFDIYAGTDPARVGELVPVICNELNDVKHNVSPSELKRAQAQARADLLMGQENAMRRAEMLGHQLLAFGLPIPAAQILKHVMAVTPKDVEAVARKIFVRKPLITALGPVEKLESYGRIAERLKRI
ncbi:MAG: M16 family metallopeptidase, partial [Bdellovibrionales bacterium]